MGGCACSLLGERVCFFWNGRMLSAFRTARVRAQPMTCQFCPCCEGALLVVKLFPLQHSAERAVVRLSLPAHCNLSSQVLRRKCVEIIAVCRGIQPPFGDTGLYWQVPHNL